uniref:Uncharacterized protein n=1 Tax=Lepeophtheirus salmonis TaxID=72036 RepID=A0A0K2V3I7_LEPSM
MKLTFLPKPDKKDYSLSKSFRPITLSNFMFEVLEWILHWEVEEDIPTLHS